MNSVILIINLWSLTTETQNPNECVMCVRGWGRTGKKTGVGRTVPYRKAPLAIGGGEEKK